MIGYVVPNNNNLYLFFENDEMRFLQDGALTGTFVNFKAPEKQGSLEVMIDDSIDDLIITDLEKDDSEMFITSYTVKMRSSIYHKFLHRNTYGVHEGFRHVNLRNANCLDGIGEKMNYNNAKASVLQQSE